MIPQRLGKNIGRYCGDPIDLPRVLRDLDRAADAKNWTRDFVPLVVTKAPLPINFLAYRRPNENARVRVYISAGIHGDEPAGPLAALQLLQDNQWPADVAVWLCPCLNPSGILLNQRENFEGIDLNRDYRHFRSAEVRAHLEWLKQQPRFDITLCLHEDWESHGFYVYEVSPEDRPSLAEKIVEAVSKVCPIETAEVVDDWPARNGVIHPRVNPEERPLWPEALYLVTNKSRQSYTMEAPSDFPLPTRVAALVAAVRTVLNLL